MTALPSLNGAARSRYAVRALERGLAVLHTIATSAHEPSLVEVAAACALTKASAYRVLMTLQDLGYVQQDASTKRYRLGLRALAVGHGYVNAPDLANAVLPYLERLTRHFDETTTLAQLDGAQIVYIARVMSNRVLNAAFPLGMRQPAYCTSLGKVMLAFRPPAEVDQAIAMTAFERLTPHTVGSGAELRAQLDGVRERGYCISDGDMELGVITAAASIRDATGRAIAAINVITTTLRFSAQRLEEEFVPHLLAATDEISAALGFAPARKEAALT
jgi:IclR family pca regulon transcriptional regulator